MVESLHQATFSLLPTNSLHALCQPSRQNCSLEMQEII